MVGDFETLERWIGCVILIRGCEDQGCLHLSPIWWWQKREEEYFEDCSLKILDDIAWFKGKSHVSWHINFRGSSCLLVLPLSTRGRLLGITFELIKTKHVEHEGLIMTKRKTSMWRIYRRSFYLLGRYSVLLQTYLFVTLVSLLYKEIHGIGFRCARKCVCTKGVKRVVCVGLHVPQDVDASICFSPKIISLILLM